MTEPAFVAPEPGVWDITREFRHPVSRVLWPLLETVWGAGFREIAGDYGLFFHTRGRFVNGFLYQSLCLFDLNVAQQIALAPLAFRRGVRLRGLYFDVVLKNVLGRWFGRMKDVFVRRPWRRELEIWDTETKPRIGRTFQELAAVDPGDLADVDLAAHLRACAEAFVSAWHHADAVTIIWMVPVGDYLAQAQAGGKASLLELASSMTWLGSTRASTFSVSREKKALPADAIAEAEAALAAGRPTVDTIDALWDVLRRADPELYQHCWVQSFTPVFGFDITEPSLREMPDVLLPNLATVFSPPGDAAPHAEPAGDPELAALAEEARAVMRVKDERELLLQGPARGLLRRALLEVGTRLAARERLAEAEEAFDLSVDEAIALLGADDPAVSKAAAERTAYRRRVTTDDAPAVLGATGADVNKMADGGFGWLPEEGARRLLTALTVAGDWRSGTAAAKPSSAPSTDGVLRGIAASAGRYQGRARLVVSGTLQELERIQQDDVLVAPMTSTTFMPMLARVRAVVTDLGGPLSHPAVVSREYGIPSVVGCGTATREIADGDLVLVDGTAGTVEILERAALRPTA